MRLPLATFLHLLLSINILCHEFYALALVGLGTINDIDRLFCISPERKNAHLSFPLLREMSEISFFALFFVESMMSLSVPVLCVSAVWLCALHQLQLFTNETNISPKFKCPLFSPYVTIYGTLRLCHYFRSYSTSMKKNNRTNFTLSLVFLLLN